MNSKAGLLFADFETTRRLCENWPVDGETQSGWFAHDFTLAEIKTYADGIGP